MNANDIKSTVTQAFDYVLKNTIGVQLSSLCT